MPQPRPTLGTADITAHSELLFAARPGDLVGIELEWPVHCRGDINSRPDPADFAALDATFLPAGGRITFEPGGQVELSTAPFASVGEAIRATRSDARILFARMEAAGFSCQTLAVDDRRAPRRILSKPRYRAMDAFFSEQGPTGRWMMTNTASTQINVSHDQDDPSLRWNMLHRISPVLIAAFANSPGLDFAGRRWACLREAIWFSIDPARTRPVRTDLDPTQAWLEYALAADVMFICDEGSSGATGAALPPGMTFGQWMNDGHAFGWPTIEDFRQHLTTLFPPVRPRGWLELRVLDALPEWIREVAVLTVATACSTGAAHEILERVPDTGELWLTAAREGLANPALAAAAAVVFDIVTAHVVATTSDSALADQLATFRGRYVDRQRCPGDDLAREFDLRRPVLISTGLPA